MPGESPLDFIRKNSQIDTVPSQSREEQIFNSVKESHERENSEQTKYENSRPQKTAEEKQELGNDNKRGDTKPGVSEPEPSFETGEVAPASPKEKSNEEKKASPDTAKDAEPKLEDGDEDAFAEEVLAADKSPAKESFKRLHVKLKDTNKTLRETSANLAKAQKELEDFKTGRVAPEIIKEKEKEIERLSRYEKLHNLKSSKEYQEKYVNPLKQQKERLKNIFKDYEIPETEIDGIINKLASSNSERELNTFLSESFDGVGAFEVKGILNSIRSLSSEAKAAEENPVQVLETLQQESQRIFQDQERGRKIKVFENAKSSWRSAVMDIREAGEIPELIRREGDEEFNQNFPDRILANAAQDFQELVKELAESGVKELSPNTMKALAKSFLQAHATGVAVSTRNKAVQDIENIEKNAGRLNGILRPNIGSGVPSGPARAPQADTTPEQDANAITQRILSKRS